MCGRRGGAAAWEKPREGAQDLPDRLGRPRSPAAWKPRGCSGGGGGCSGKSHLSPKPSRTGWGTGMNQGAGFCLLQLRNKWLGHLNLSYKSAACWLPHPQGPGQGPSSAAPNFPRASQKQTAPLSATPSSALAFGLCLSALSGMLTLHLPHFLWPGGRRMHWRLGRSLWAPLLGHIFLNGLR